MTATDGSTAALSNRVGAVIGVGLVGAVVRPLSYVSDYVFDVEGVFGKCADGLWADAGRCIAGPDADRREVFGVCVALVPGGGADGGVGVAGGVGRGSGGGAPPGACGSGAGDVLPLSLGGQSVAAAVKAGEGDVGATVIAGRGGVGVERRGEAGAGLSGAFAKRVAGGQPFGDGQCVRPGGGVVPVDAFDRAIGTASGEEPGRSAHEVAPLVMGDLVDLHGEGSGEGDGSQGLV